MSTSWAQTILGITVFDKNIKKSMQLFSKTTLQHEKILQMLSHFIVLMYRPYGANAYSSTY